MQPFTRVTGPATPLMLANVDTDVIIRIERLTSGADLGHYAMEALRYLPNGSPNPDSILNQPAFVGAPVLLAGANFGCGSSREGAVTALLAMGVRCVIAPSFGDIFFANSFRNGLLPIVLAENEIASLADIGGADVTVDLTSQTIATAGHPDIAFLADPLEREALLDGLDELGVTQKSLPIIDAWQTADRIARPWVWATGDIRL